jgi:negative regulator of flagellin synthesis FlgM
MDKAAAIARNTPDVREDRVTALKAQIDAGTYQVDSGKIADGMLREAIKDHIARNDER